MVWRRNRGHENMRVASGAFGRVDYSSGEGLRVQGEFAMLLVWILIPLVVLGAGGTATSWGQRRAAVVHQFDPVLRLEQLRARREAGRRVVRGRMTEALRMAEGSTPAMALQTRQR